MLQGKQILTDCCENIGKAKVINSIEWEEMIQELFFLIIAAEECITLVEFSDKAKHIICHSNKILSVKCFLLCKFIRYTMNYRQAITNEIWYWESQALSMCQDTPTLFSARLTSPKSISPILVIFHPSNVMFGLRVFSHPKTPQDGKRNFALSQKELTSFDHIKWQNWSKESSPKLLLSRGCHGRDLQHMIYDRRLFSKDIRQKLGLSTSVRL